MHRKIKSSQRVQQLIIVRQLYLYRLFKATGVAAGKSWPLPGCSGRNLWFGVVKRRLVRRKACFWLPAHWRSSLIVAFELHLDAGPSFWAFCV
jgi:hypothetical protein